MRTPSPSAVLDAAARSLASDLKRLAFDGEEAAFFDLLGTYLHTFGSEDPFARYAMTLVARDPYGLLSFRTRTTDRRESEQGRALRWRMWLTALPLDLQMNVLFLEYWPPDACFSLERAVGWSQLHAVLDAPDPAATFRTSPLGGWLADGTPGPGSPLALGPAQDARVPRAWDEAVAQVRADGQIHAVRLMADAAWEPLNAWLASSGLCATETVAQPYVHYRSRYSSGSSAVTARHALPLWAMGLFANAHEPGFWAAMAQAGGPRGPVTGPPWSERPAPEIPCRGRFPEALPPPDFDDPLAWVEPRSLLPEDACSSVARTAAAWRQQVLEAAIARSGVSQRTVTKRL